MIAGADSDRRWRVQGARGDVSWRRRRACLCCGLQTWPTIRPSVSRSGHRWRFSPQRKLRRVMPHPPRCRGHGMEQRACRDSKLVGGWVPSLKCYRTIFNTTHPSSVNRACYWRGHTWIVVWAQVNRALPIATNQVLKTKMVTPLKPQLDRREDIVPWPATFTSGVMRSLSS